LLQQFGVVLPVSRVEPLQNLRDRALVRRREAEARQAGFDGAARGAAADIHRQAQQGLGPGRGQVLDLHAAGRRKQNDRALGLGIVEHGGIVFRRDRHLGLDQHLRDLVAADLQGQDFRRRRAGLRGIAGQLDAAGLAALAGRYLGLDHAGADARRGRLGFLCAGRKLPRRRGDPRRREQGLGGVFLEVHRRLFSVFGPVRAEQRLLGGAVLGDRGHQMGQVDEMAPA